MPVPLSQLSRYLTVVPCSMALMGERRYLGLSSFLSWNSTVFLHVCMHVSTPCLVIVGSYVILIISSQITHNYQFVKYTEKASTLGKKRNENPMEKKSAGMFGGYFNSAQTTLLKSCFLQIKCCFPPASYPSNTQLPNILKAWELRPA